MINLAIGEFATLELLKNHLSSCNKVIVKNKKYLDKLKNYKVKIVVDPIYFKNNIKKEDIYIVSEFTPYRMKLNNCSSHILIYDLNDEGEIGTILRTAIAFDFKNVVLINSNVDIFSPKLIRASTGALFMVNLVKYKNKKDYLIDYPNCKAIEFKYSPNLSLEVGNKLYKITQRQCDNR